MTNGGPNPAKCYLIEEGIRRSIVAREAGLDSIQGYLHVDGQSPVLMDFPLDCLFATKTEIPRDYRYIVRNEYPFVVLGTPTPPIEVHAISCRRAIKYFTPIRTIPLV